MDEEKEKTAEEATLFSSEEENDQVESATAREQRRMRRADLLQTAID